ncbi:MAG: sulfite exporter TauE/SafE family protein [Phycisphaerales bacterium]|nr:sulfite exporter TauE/SafE family protein [Phycisphaerales bacterium]
MFALFAAVMVASLLGSAHCAGMCGAFVAIAVCGVADCPRWRLHAAYHGGRLLTYVTLGAIAGGLGAMIDFSAAATIGAQRAAAALAGALMVAFGVTQLLRLRGVRLPSAPVPKFLHRFVLRGHQSAMSLRPQYRALALGLLTTLLPCGWLYAFVITAAGTGKPLVGAAAMGAFWVGTVPVLVTVGVGAQRAAGWLGSRLPLLTSLALVGVGLWTLAGRLTIPLEALRSLEPAAKAATLQGEAGADDTENAALIQHVESLDSGEAPCCHKP